MSDANVSKNRVLAELEDLDRVDAVLLARIQTIEGYLKRHDPREIRAEVAGAVKALFDARSSGIESAIAMERSSLNALVAAQNAKIAELTARLEVLESNLTRYMTSDKLTLTKDAIRAALRAERGEE